MDTGVLGAAYPQFVPGCCSRVHRVHQRSGQSGWIFGAVRDRRPSLSGIHPDGLSDGDRNSLRGGGDADMAGRGTAARRAVSSPGEPDAGQSMKLILLFPERCEPRQ